MKLTNQQIEDACMALEVFNPAVSLKCKLRLSRNLRKLTTARQDKEHDRLRLCYANVADKTKVPQQGQQVILSAEEQLKFQPEYQKLMQEEVEVEVHPIKLWDASESPGALPGADECAIDISTTPIPNEVLSRLIDIVFVAD